MIDLSAEFDEFLEEISIDEPQSSRMERAAAAIIEFLGARYDLPQGNFFLQGSYPNGTAVEPTEDGEYDVDLVAVCVDGSATADSALDTLTEHFESDGRYASRIVRKNPCVRLEHAEDNVGKFHIDVVPVRPTGNVSPPLKAPRRKEGWHETAPAEYTQWCLSQGDPFARTVKVMKRWRDVQQDVRSSVKSIVLQVLVAQHLPAYAFADADRVSSTFRSLYVTLSPLTEPPVILNPVLPSEDLARAWSEQAFRNFVNELQEAVEFVDKAEAATDKVESTEVWRELLGDDFPAAQAAKLGLSFEDLSHEQPFAAKGWGLALDPRYRVAVSVTQQRGKRGQQQRPYKPGGPPVMAGHRLRFKAHVTAPGHHEVWWQVTNTGGHAASKQALRGGFLRAKSITNGVSKDPTIHWESTAYTGKHRVRAVLVRDDVVVAVSSYVHVDIYSPLWRPGRWT